MSLDTMDENGQVPEELCSSVADCRRQLNSLLAVRKCLREIALVVMRIRAHVEIGHLDRAESVRTAKIDTAVKIPMRCLHPPERIVGIAETAQGTRRILCRATHLGGLERLFVLGEATLQFPEGEIEVAAQMIDSRQIQCPL